MGLYKAKPVSSSHRDLDRRDLHGVAYLLRAAHQACGDFCGRWTPRSCHGAWLRMHVPDRGQHRGGDGEDGLLGAAPGAQAVELRLQVAVLDAHGGPGRPASGSV